MIVLVFGGRKYTDWVKQHRTLDRFLADVPTRELIIVEGGASGADTGARQWAVKRGVHYAEVPALWDVYNDSAGPRRNSAMLLLRPDRAVAFPGDNGTADMLAKVTDYMKATFSDWEERIAVID